MPWCVGGSRRRARVYVGQGFDDAAKAALAVATRERPKVISHPKQVEGYLRNLLRSLEADEAGARELLARHMPPLILTPDGRAYRITGGFDMSLALGEGAALVEAIDGGSGPSGASADQKVCEKLGRRDPLLIFPHTSMARFGALIAAGTAA